CARVAATWGDYYWSFDSW
nr:immunoglobulin heavy chain junction region [Macaca mulatta]MOV42732.1 immunoglobulin heavy chain junction region [Macaca mulatta]MOV46472.1 immunoglobulin heavy chain junction region [Macaca mulatta]